MKEKSISEKRKLLRCNFSLFLILAFIFSSNFFIASAQNNSNVSGVVKDATGEPIPGVSVIVDGNTSLGTVTDIDGNYSIGLPDASVSLVFSFIGFETQKIPVNNRRIIDVVMGEDVQLIDEVVVVAYGTQKKVNLTGAVSAVTSKEISTATNSNVQNLLTGKLPGLRIQQRTGEPGDYNAKMDIRGMGTPLIIIDGVTRDVAAFQRLDANEIESVSVLKDGAAAVYGMRAGNGVMLVTTKKGANEKTKINYTGTFGFQNPSGLPDVLNAHQYAELVREADKNMGRGINATFTQDDVDRFRREGATDWQSLALKNTAPVMQHNLTASGGSDKMNYFLSLGYYDEDGIWKSGDMNYERFNIRSNLGFKITEHLRAEALISIVSDEKNQPFKDTWEVFKSIWMLKPTETAYANNNENYINDTMYGLNPLAILDKDKVGYKQFNNRTANTTFSVTYDAPFLPGLSAKFLYSYDYKRLDSKQFQKKYTLYKYDSATEEYYPQNYAGPSALYKNSWDGKKEQMVFSLNFQRSFQDSHNLSVLLLTERNSNTEDNYWARKEFQMDAVDEFYAGIDDETTTVGADAGKIWKDTNVGFVGRVNYDYQSKYLLEAGFRYDGSSKFSKDHRWGFFPTVSVGYRISEENFLRNINALSFLTNLKLRASYGVMGDDSSSRYQYLSGYDYPGASYIFGDEVYNGLGFRALANDKLSWFTYKNLNIGADADLWNGLLTGQVDFFWRYGSGLLAERGGTLPGTIGVAMPQENINEDLYKGFEVVLGHNNKINDFHYSVSANFALTRRKNRYLLEGDFVNSYAKWRGSYANRYSDMGWGYGSNGQFQSFEDIWGSAIQDGLGGSSQLPGDWKYQDWNEDGVIDDNDVYPMSFEHSNDKGNPKMTFGMTLTAAWKGFDLNMLFQGGAGFHVIYFEQLQYPLCFGGNGLAHFYDRWHQDDNGDWISGEWPTTRDAGSYGTNYARAKQTTYDASYLRLKSAEIGYTIPASITRKFYVDRLRLFANGYNLFTISGLDFVDPEHPEGTYGYLYPIMRNFTFGVNLTF